MAAEGEGVNIDDVFKSLAKELGNVSNALGAQGIASIVSSFDGSNPKLFTQWIRDIEKYAKITNLDDKKKIMVAFQTSKGPVSGYVERFTVAQPDSTFDELKRELARRFAEISDAQHALSLLRQVKQKPGENIQVYAERLLILAENAYPGPGNPAVERQLTEIFIDGLRDDHLKLKLMRDRPATLQGAITAATTEQNLRKRVSMTHPKPHFQTHNSQGFESMEVDHLQQKKCFKCHNFGHTARNCQQRMINVVQGNRKEINNRRRSLECWNCGKMGHIQRFCRLPQKANRILIKPEN